MSVLFRRASGGVETERLAARRRTHSENEEDSRQSPVSSQVARISRQVQLVGEQDRMNVRRFYFTLPSNSSMNYYPSNTVARYTTKLPQVTELDGDWEVALTEISIPAQLPNRDGKEPSLLGFSSVRVL